MSNYFPGPKVDNIGIVIPNLAQHFIRMLAQRGARVRMPPGVADNRTAVFASGTGLAAPG